MSDRIKIVRRAAWPDINISPQVLISCSTEGPPTDFDNGCHGGEAFNAFKFMNMNEVTDETCAIYRARGRDNGEKCSQQLICDNCDPGSVGCFAQDNYKYYHTNSYGRVSGEQAMMQEIYQRGPIACGIVANQELLDYKSGIFDYEGGTGPADIDHDISVVGFGVAGGIKFWTVRNSWGSAWGEDGFFRLIRGTNNIQIEHDCAWTTPVDTWTNDRRHTLTATEKLDLRIGNADDEQMKKEEKFMAVENKACRKPTTMPKAK